jgi:UDP-N-acetylmuramoylalanine--D-glutamate ligase
LLQTAGVGDAAIQAALNSLNPLPHRMTTVCNTQGIAFIDNSKATNLAALVASVRMCSGPVRLIAGGLAKEKDFRSAKEVLAQRARRVYLIGKAAEAMQTAWSEDVSCCMAGTLDQAVEMAWQEAAPGEVILLAPGCASFDQFRNFEERGRVFADLAQQVSQRRRNDPRSVLQY